MPTPLDPNAIRGRRTQPPAEETPHVRLCQACPTGDGQVQLGERLLCRSCYERERPRQTIDQKRGSILRANPDWQRQRGEDSRDYGLRMARLCRELAGQLAEKRYSRTATR